MTGNSLLPVRVLPDIIEKDYFLRNDYLQPTIYTENPEFALAQANPRAYINALRTQIKNTHEENMLRIQSEHIQNMEALRQAKQAIHTNVANNYISGLKSEDRLNVQEIIVEPFTEREGWFGMTRKEEGIHLIIKTK